VSNSADNPRRQKDNRPYQFQHAAHGNSNHAKRQKKQPDQRIQHQGNKRQWPAQHQKYAPQEEFNHRVIASKTDLRTGQSYQIYEGGSEEVPDGARQGLNAVGSG